MISVLCECGTELTVRAEMAGQLGRCPACASVVTIAATAEPEIELEIEIVLDEQAPLPARPLPIVDEGRRPSLDRAPLRSKSTKAAEEKSFFQLLGEAFISPSECFESFGTYVFKDFNSVVMVIGLFFLGMVLRSIGQTQGAQSLTLTLATTIVGTILLIGLTAFKAVVIELTALVIGGVSRFMNLAIGLVFVEGLTGATYGILAILPIPFYVKYLVVPWSIGLYLLLIAKTYDYPAIFALFIAVMVWFVGWAMTVFVMYAVLMGLS